MNLGVFLFILNMKRDQLNVTKIKDLSGLYKTEPLIAGCLALLFFSMAGIPPLAGFWSKDEILASVFANGGMYYIFWVLGLSAALLTAFYMGRHWLLIFEKDNGFDHSDVIEAPKTMTRPLIVLGLFSIFIGFINSLSL